MKQIGLLIKEYTPPKRKDLVKKFVDILEKDRAFNKLASLPASFYAVKMSMIPTHDLESYFNECYRTDNFSKTWWGRLKNKG